MSTRRKKCLHRSNLEREKEFNLDFKNDKLPQYNALRDRHLLHFFENRTVQTHLYETGLIDRNGRVMDPDKNKSRLFIIEQEFKNAERAEQWRKKEEEEMRRRVQRKRQENLEAARKLERMRNMRDDREIRKQIMSATQAMFQVSKLQNKTILKKSKPAKTRKAKPQRRKNDDCTEPASESALNYEEAMEDATAAIEAAQNQLKG